MNISIVIPTYEMHRYGVGYLDRLLESILNQSSIPYEVIISDHSINEEVDTYVANLNGIISHPVKYFRNENGRGSSSANLNNAIRLAEGDVIKPMFQDDFFYSMEALLLLDAWFEDGASWVACGNNMFKRDRGYYDPLIPSWNNDMILGKNTLSSPSCMAYLNNGMLWDERLLWMMDCEFYQRLYERYGEPTIEEEILVTNRAHDKQLTNLLSDERKAWEVSLMKKEHGRD
jgi:glycosyltransferase involved in cell wall biosynthesis